MFRIMPIIMRSKVPWTTGHKPVYSSLVFPRDQIKIIFRGNIRACGNVWDTVRGFILFPDTIFF